MGQTQLAAAAPARRKPNSKRRSSVLPCEIHKASNPGAFAIDEELGREDMIMRGGDGVFPVPAHESLARTARSFSICVYTPPKHWSQAALAAH